jgi:hypothetical protein
MPDNRKDLKSPCVSPLAWKVAVQGVGVGPPSVAFARDYIHRAGGTITKLVNPRATRRPAGPKSQPQMPPIGLEPMSFGLRVGDLLGTFSPQLSAMSDEKPASPLVFEWCMPTSFRISPSLRSALRSDPCLYSSRPGGAVCAFVRAEPKRPVHHGWT